MNKHFIPVKITKKEYADKLVQGEVFMRALHEFGSWGDVSEKDPALLNDYRGDFYSGVTAVFSNPKDYGYFARIAEKTPISNCCLIDESDIQYFKIFSLSCYELNDTRQEFYKPDSRMARFGDTAVLIIDFCEFLDRYARALFAKYDKLISLVDRVQPFNFRQSRWLNPLFCKHESQAYQNEIRIAFGTLEKNIFAIGPGAEDANSMIMNYDPVTLQLGDLSDITVEMPIEDFLLAKLPKGFKCRWPENERPNPPSNYETVHEWTQEQMKNYHSIHVRPAYTVVGDSSVHTDEILPFVEFVRQCYENDRKNV